MRISDVAKKGVALVMTMALAVGAVAVAPSEASAAKKKKDVSKNVTVRLMYAADTNADGCSWLIGTDSTASSQFTKSFKMTQGKTNKVSITAKVPTKFNKKKVTKVDGAVVLVVDMMRIQEAFNVDKKKIKVSNVVLKGDGKKISCKPAIGSFEENKADSKYNYRISFYNQYGANGDNSKSKNKASKFKMKKSISVSFNVKINK